MNKEKEYFEAALKKVNYFLKLVGLQLELKNSGKTLFERLRTRWLFLFHLLWYNRDGLGGVAWFIDGVIQRKTFLEFTYLGPCMCQVLLANVKSYYFIKYEHEVNDLVYTLRYLQTSEKKSAKIDSDIEKLLSPSSFLSRVITMYSWLNIGSLAGFALLPFLIIAATYSAQGEIELVTPFLVWYPFNAFDIRIWPFVYIHQMYTGTAVVFIIFGPDCLYYFCCTYIQLQFKILQCDMMRIAKRYQKETKNYLNESLYITQIQDTFVLLVKRHTELIRYISLMERIFSKCTLVNVVSSSFLICLTGFNATSIDNIYLKSPFIGFLFIVLVQIFLLCYFGDIIMRSSTQFSEAVYKCDWYNVKPKVAKDLLFVLVRSQKHCKLTAYGFSDINLRTLSKILSTAWSYFALLKTMNHNGV